MYPEYAEEVKTSNESPNNNKMARTISLQKTFETQTYPSRSQVNCSDRKGFHLKFGSKSGIIMGTSGIKNWKFHGIQARYKLFWIWLSQTYRSWSQVNHIQLDGYAQRVNSVELSEKASFLKVTRQIMIKKLKADLNFDQTEKYRGSWGVSPFSDSQFLTVSQFWMDIKSKIHGKPAKRPSLKKYHTVILINYF